MLCANGETERRGAGQRLKPGALTRAAFLIAEEIVIRQTRGRRNAYIGSTARVASGGLGTFPEKAKDERAEIRKMEADTLTRLYSLEPSAKGEVNGAAGYAVFSNFGMKILAVGARGMDVPTHRDGRGSGGNGQGHQVLEG